VQTADRMQIYKYVVHQVAQAYGKTATFMPKPIFGDNGSGMHVHQSIWNNGKPLFAGNGYAGLSEMCLYFIGGIIKHAKALNAFTNPTTNSYKRLVPGYEAPVLLAYSARNRSASCRIPTVLAQGQARRVRFPDPMANPYLAFAALLMAGLDGIENKIHPGRRWTRTSTTCRRKNWKKVPTVCGSLREALDSLEADHDFLLKGGVFTKDQIEAPSFGINQEYQRGVLFRLGRVKETKGPGWYWLIPLIERVVKVDMRIITFALATQETVTRDGVAVRVNAVLWYSAVDPVAVVTAVENWQAAVIQAAETGMRDATGQSDLDQMLKDRTTINERLLKLLAETCRRWGVAVDAVEIKDLDIPEQMQRAIAREAEAIREKRARIIKAEGEQEAARTLADAARTIGEAPGALELRRLQTLTEIGAEHNSTIIAMFPTELLQAAQAIGKSRE
jgi:regulator of protease activity HflC (stomatin/prohibitin superfamily)